MITLPDPMPLRMLSTSRVEVPKTTSILVPEQSIPKDKSLYLLPYPSRAYTSKCPCLFKAWFTKVLMARIPETSSLLVVDKADSFVMQWLTERYPTWVILS